MSRRCAAGSRAWVCGGHVRLVGHVDDIAAAYLAAHVTVVASTEPEAFGRAAIEAAAVACPVIATDLGAPPETVLAAPAEQDEERDRLAGAAGRRGSAGEAPGGGPCPRPARPRPIGERARRHAVANFSVEAMQQSTLGVYDRLLETSLQAGFKADSPRRFCAVPPPNDLDLRAASPQFLLTMNAVGHCLKRGGGERRCYNNEGDCNIRRPMRAAPERAPSGPRMNEDIRVPEVRLIDQTGQNVGVVATSDAMARATEAGLDLVEISPDSEPPVAKILDYGKFKYQEQKKAAEARKRQKVVEIKEIKMRPSIDDHDYDVKMRSIKRFFDEGDKVKVTLRFRGRELSHQELGWQVLQRVKSDTEPIAKVESEPRMEGRQMVMVLAPR